MNSYIYLCFSVVGFAVMGILHKCGDKLHCQPHMVAMLAMLSAGLLGIGSMAVHSHSTMTISIQFVYLAIPFGMSAAVALWLFQKALPYGHIATSWLIVNLSAGVPTLLSAVVYGDEINVLKMCAMALIIICLLLLWRDRKQTSQSGPKCQQVIANPWLVLMFFVFIFNGACTFGHRMLAQGKPTDEVVSQYLVCWYLIGAACLLPVAIAMRRPPRSADFLTGGGLGLASFCAQLSLAKALAGGVPGSVGYPVALTGGLLLVVIAGVAVFEERVGAFGTIGIACGLGAMVLLALP